MIYNNIDTNINTNTNNANFADQYQITHSYNNELPCGHKELQIVYMNSGSARNKIELIEAFVNNPNRNVIALVLTETWFFNYEGIIFNINGFHAHHSYRADDENRGGGVSIYVRDRFLAQITQNETSFYNNWLVVSIPELKISIGGIYRYTNRFNDVNAFIDFTDNVIGPSGDTIFMTDSNIDLLEHNSTTTNSYMQMVNHHGYSFLNNIIEDAATRRSNTRRSKIKSILDTSLIYSVIIINCH